MKSSALSVTLTAAMSLVSTSALAGPIISYGGQTPTDGSGLTSSRISASNTMDPSSGYFVETFDRSTYQQLDSVDPGYIGINGAGTSGTTDASNLGNADGNQAGCSINAFGGPDITGSFAVQQGSTGNAAAPADNSTCFAFGPQADGRLPAVARIDYAPILAAGDSINYLGLYYGSIDTYNEILFYSGDTLLGGLTGTDILNAQDGNSGNQFQAGSNVYVNLDFAAVDAFTAFEFHTTGIAFEFDNVVVGLSSRSSTVPAPATFALMLLGMLGLPFMRRRRASN